MNILYAVLCLGVMGAGFGLALAIASKKFAVEENPKKEEIDKLLPGANCGGCGYPGCSSFAKAVSAGEAPTSGCVPGGNEIANKIACIMGLAPEKVERTVAMVRCSGGENAAKKYKYAGLQDCVSASKLEGGPLECPHGCLGLGTCVSACPFDAIYLEKGIALVDHEKCTGCFACINACPKKVIIKVPYAADVTVACSSRQKGAILRKYCDIGCLGCKICEKTCPHSAIHIEDNLASIDYQKCTGCGLCAQKCPRKLICNAHLRTDEDISATESP